MGVRIQTVKQRKDGTGNAKFDVQIVLTGMDEETFNNREKLRSLLEETGRRLEVAWKTKIRMWLTGLQHGSDLIDVKEQNLTEEEIEVMP